MAKHTSHDYVIIYLSELQVICANAVARSGIETGGICFGARSRGGRPIVFYVTGPGPNAIHAYARFQQDVDFFHRVVTFIEEHYGIQYIGDHHSHHGLGLDHPSSGDLSQVESVRQRNNFGPWMGMIVTLGGYGPRKNWQDRSEADDPEQARGSAKVRVNAFLYDNGGGYRECPIRVLKTMSPVRVALLAAGRQDLGGVGHFAPSFPLEQISYDAYQDSASSQEAEGIPETLVEQLRKLVPMGLKEDVDLSVAESVVIVTLPLPTTGCAEVALSLDEPHLVERVRLRRGIDQDFEDITAHFSSKTTQITLVELYGRLASACRETDAPGPRIDKRVGFLATLPDRVPVRSTDKHVPESRSAGTD